MTKIILLFIFTAFVFGTKSFSASIICKTSNELKVFKINKKTISFLNSDSNSRDIASALNVRSRSTRFGFTKSVNYEGKEHIFHVANKKQFSNLDDYYIVRNQKGHEVIYPINCTKK